MTDGTPESGQIDSNSKNWFPASLSEDMAQIFGRPLTNARSHDLTRNDGHARGALNDMLNTTVADGLTLQHAVQARLLGWDLQRAEAFNQRVEDLYRLWSGSVHKIASQDRRMTWGQMQRQFLAHRFIDGDMFAGVHHNPDQLALGVGSTMSLSMIHPDRVAEHPGHATFNSLARGKATIRAGMEFDADGRWTHVHIANRHPSEIGLDGTAMELPKRLKVSTPRLTWKGQAFSRPRYLHVSDPERAGQSRGVGLFSTIATRVKDKRRLAKTLLVNYAVQAALVGVLKTTDTLLGAKNTTNPTTIGNNKDQFKAVTELNGLLKAHYGGMQPTEGQPWWMKLFPGDDVELNGFTQDAAAHSFFDTVVNRETAAALGMSYEELARNFSDTNYSAARAAFNQAYRSIRHHARILRDELLRPVLLLLIQEWWMLGLFDDIVRSGDPTIFQAADLYMAETWTAPARDQLDREKEVKADAMAVQNRIETITTIAARQGRTVEQVAQEEARERAIYESFNLSHPMDAQMPSTAYAPAQPETKD